MWIDNQRIIWLCLWSEERREMISYEGFERQAEEVCEVHSTALCECVCTLLGMMLQMCDGLRDIRVCILECALLARAAILQATGKRSLSIYCALALH